MDKLEPLAVQFLEIERFVEQGDQPHARLALILVDNFAELVMARSLKEELRYNDLKARLLEGYEQAGDRLPDDLVPNRDELREQVLSKTKLKKLEREFSEKVDHLQKLDYFSEAEGAVLKRLHEYRNDTYHRDRQRPAVLLSATKLYIYLACRALQRYKPWTFMVATSEPVSFPAIDTLVARLPEDVRNTVWRTPAMIADGMLAGLHLDKGAIGTALIVHLHERVEGMITMIAEAMAFFGMSPDDVVRLAQLQDDASITELDELRRRKVDHSFNDLEDWQTQIDQLDHDADVVDLFAAFAAIEKAFEPLESRLTEVNEFIDRQIDYQIDEARGK